MNQDPDYFRRKKAKFFLFVPLIIAAVSGIVMWLWNAILPDVLGVKTITFWQAAGLLVLCKILFGGFGFAKNNHNGPGESFREKWRNKFNTEEKERIREEWKKRCENWNAGDRR